MTGWLVSDSWITGLQIAGIAAVLNSTLYWIHERLWNRAQWNRDLKNNLMFVDGQPRTISKTITWRFVVVGSNFIIPFVLTGQWGTALLYAGTATLVNMGLYWLHERGWNYITWGKAVTQ